MMGGGCAITSPAPGGPLRQGAYLRVQPTWAVSYAPGDAVVTPPQGVSAKAGPVSGNTQSFGGDPTLTAVGTVIPISLGLRQSVGRFADVGADLGWLDSGVEVRVGPSDATAALPFVVSASARSSRLALLKLDEQTYQGRLRFEAYPRIEELPFLSRRAIVGGGVSFGTFLHDLGVPAIPDPNPPEIGGGPPHVMLTRPEVRLEGVFGYERHDDRFGLMVAVAPWIVAAHGAVSSRDWIVSSFSQDVGVTLLVSFTFGGDPTTPPTSPPLMSR